MKSKGFFKRKYFFAIIIILAVYLVSDILLHKGQARVLIPGAFGRPNTDVLYPKCSNPLIVTRKQWAKAVNSTVSAADVRQRVGGIEIDVYFDNREEKFYAYHDSSAMSNTTLTDVLNVFQTEQRHNISVWLDFKNLSEINRERSLSALIQIQKKYGLERKIIVESGSIELLQSFCRNGFFTSYYLPFFNPYLVNKHELEAIAQQICDKLERYQVSALSGYYFQYPFIEKYFPGYPFLTWASSEKFSLVSFLFNRKLLADDRLKIVLYADE